MGRILKDIAADTSLAPLLGFKGGTCAYFFYGLPRFSVDLDFDLIEGDESTQNIVFERLKTLLERHGIIKDSQLKRFTLFFLLSYGDGEHNIKVEVNVRKLIPEIKDGYESKEYLGIPLLVAKKDYLFASKLVALTQRNEMVMRDIYDIHFFAKNNWDIRTDIIEARTGKSVKAYLADCVAAIGPLRENQMLARLGELVNEKEKVWVKKELKAETLFLLRNYIEAIQ